MVNKNIDYWCLRGVEEKTHRRSGPARWHGSQAEVKRILPAGSPCDYLRKPKLQDEVSATFPTVGHCPTPDPTIAKVKPNRHR